MLKRRIIFSILFFALTIVLAHNVIPHHHHSEQEANEQHDESDHHGGESDLAHWFENFNHSNGSIEFTHSSFSIVKKSDDFFIPLFTVPINAQILLCENPHFISKDNSVKIKYSFLFCPVTSLRGPPVCA